MNTFAGPFLLWLGRASWQASVIALVVLAGQKVFPSRWTAQWRYAIWLLVVLRLALPVAIPSKISLFNYGRGWGASRTPSIASQAWPSSINDTSENRPPPPQAVSSRPVIKHAWWQRHRWEFVFSLWLGGAAIFAARTFGQNWLFLRRLGTPRPVMDQDTLALLENCRKELRVRTKVRLAETSAVKSPALCGLWRPILLLPPGLTGQFSAAELRHVFLHEMAHVKRGDAFVLWLAAVLKALHWFNPVLWLALRRMAADREMACDELALFHAGEEEKTPYGQTILKLLELCSCATPPALVGILEDRAQMRRRILMISGFKKRPLWPLPAFLLLLCLGIVTLTDAQPPVETSDNLSGVISESLRKWAHDEVVAAADYAIYSNTLANLLFLPRDQLGRELTTAYPGHLDPELAELRMRLLHAKDKWIAAQNDGETGLPAHKTAGEVYTNAQRDYDAKIDSIIDGLKARVKEDASNLEMIKSHEAALKREWERAKTARVASVITDPFLKAEEKRQSEALREWAHDEVMATADYAIFSNTLAKLLSVPNDELGSELLTAYPGNTDPELAELHIRFDQAKDKWLAARNDWDSNLPAFKTASEVYTKAQQDFDAKVQSMIHGIKTRVETDAANLEIIRSREAAVKRERDYVRAKAAEGAAAQSAGASSATAPDAGAPTQSTDPSSKADEAPLFSKGFIVNTRALLQRLDADPSAGHAVERDNQRIRDLISAAGVDLRDPGKKVMIRERTGQLYVRATQSDLDIIQRELQKFEPQPRQVLIEAEFAELSVEEARGLGFDFIPEKIKVAMTANMTLWPQQHQDLISRIKKQTEVYPWPKVSIASGAPARLEVSVVCTLSVTPEAEPDDFTISLRSVSAQAGGRMESLSGQSMIWDSQTFVLVGWGAPETDSPTKVLAVFITPKIIDTAGNRVNTDEAVYNNARRYSPPPKDD